jgi:predicted nucleotidyltransferase
MRPSPTEKLIFAKLIAGLPPEAEALVLFGSRARGQATEFSDLDIAVVFCGDTPYGVRDRDVFELGFETQDEFGDSEFASRIQLLPIYQGDRAKPIWRSIRDEGIELWNRKSSAS